MVNRLEPATFWVCEPKNPWVQNCPETETARPKPTDIRIKPSPLPTLDDIQIEVAPVDV
jgi:hypothetical protein